VSRSFCHWPPALLAATSMNAVLKVFFIVLAAKNGQIQKLHFWKFEFFVFPPKFSKLDPDFKQYFF
jgi:hypothetical protein